MIIIWYFLGVKENVDGSIANTSIGSDGRANPGKIVPQSTNGSVSDVNDTTTGKNKKFPCFDGQTQTYGN